MSEKQGDFASLSVCTIPDEDWEINWEADVNNVVPRHVGQAPRIVYDAVADDIAVVSAQTTNQNVYDLEGLLLGILRGLSVQ